MSLFSNETPSLGDGATVNGTKIQNVFHLLIPVSATQANQNLFVAPVAYKVQSVQEVHGTAGGTNAALQLEVIPSGTANGSGTSVLATPLSLTGTTNTPQKVSPASPSNISVIPAGSRLGLVPSGTLTGLADCLLQIALVRV